MILSINERLNVAIRCPVCHDTTTRDADTVCADCRTVWHEDCSERCPVCDPGINIRGQVLAELGDETVINGVPYRADGDDFLPVSSIDDVVSYAIDQEDDDGVDIAAAITRYSESARSVLAEHAPAADDLDALYQMERDLGIDVIPTDPALRNELTDGLTEASRDGVIEIDDGSYVWWGDESEWGAAVEEGILSLAVAYAQDAPSYDYSDHDFRHGHATDILTDWYGEACNQVDSWYGTHSNFFCTDTPPAAMEMIIAYYGERYSHAGYPFPAEVGTFLRSKRHDPAFRDARLKMARILHESR